MAQNLDYLALDYQSHKEALIQRIQARYPGIWNDFFAGSFGTLLINIIAYSTATLAYSLNRLAGENYVSTMTLRESAVRLGNLVGYNLANPFPATVYCAATLTSPAPAPVTLSAGTLVRTGDASAVPFLLAQNYTIPAGASFPQSTTVTFNPNSSGPQIVQSLVATTNGGLYVDCLDDTVDLRQYIIPGQIFTADGVTVYSITAISQAPGASSYNRMILISPFLGVTNNTTGWVYERRIAFIQGQVQQDLFSPATGAGYIASLVAQPVISGTVTVTVNGQAWTQGSLATADSNASVYQVQTLPVNFQTIVLFGNGAQGAAPPNNSTIVVTYYVGGGQQGNIQAGAINTTIIGLVTSLSSPVTVAVTNLQAGSGGADAETVNQARVAIPAFAQANSRAVTQSDYQALAMAFSSSLGQVDYATASVNVQNSLLEGNIVNVYAWTTAADGSLTPVAGQLKVSLQAYLQSVAMGTDYVLMVDGTTQALPFACLVQAAPGYAADTVAAQVQDAAATYVDELLPGRPAIYSDLLNALSSVNGVQKISLSAPAGDLVVPNADTAIVQPDPTEQYLVSLISIGTTTTGSTVFTGQLQYVPRDAWALSATFSSQTLVVSPDVNPGYANLNGQGLDPLQDSNVNLTTGLVTIYAIGVVGSLIFQYNQAVGYDTVRQTDIYIGYTGDQTQATRRAIRSALRQWSSGLTVGATLYAYPPAQTYPATSVYGVVNNFSTVGIVTQVSLDNPSNASFQINVGPTTLIILKSIIINNFID